MISKKKMNAVKRDVRDIGFWTVKSNGSQLKNPDISGAIYTLRIQYSYTQTQCDDGARDVRVLELTPVMLHIGSADPNFSLFEVGRKSRVFKDKMEEWVDKLNIHKIQTQTFLFANLNHFSLISYTIYFRCNIFCLPWILNEPYHNDVCSWIFRFWICTILHTPVTQAAYIGPTFIQFIFIGRILLLRIWRK